MSNTTRLLAAFLKMVRTASFQFISYSLPDISKFSFCYLIFSHILFKAIEFFAISFLLLLMYYMPLMRASFSTRSPRMVLPGHWSAFSRIITKRTFASCLTSHFASQGNFSLKSTSTFTFHFTSAYIDIHYYRFTP